MNLILLSGGSGKRLWPLSNEIRSKQFMKLFMSPAGEAESMVQRVYRQIRAADPEATVTVATSGTQVSAIEQQLGQGVGISKEPCRRDTFGAIVLAAAYLVDVKGVDPEEPVVICPVDPYVEEGYFHALKRLCTLAGSEETALWLLGLEPEGPSEKYGYIQPETTEEISRVLGFREKPDAVTAASYIAGGALWNGGVFALRLSYVLNKAREQFPFKDYHDLYHRYENFPKISFDYAVVEQEPNIKVLRYAGQWKDLGTWQELTGALDRNCVGEGEGTLGDACENVHIINEMSIPVLAMGLRDVVIAASPEGILVADKERADHIKPYVERMDQRVMFAEKSWGSFRVLEVEEGSLTIKVTLRPGHSMNYHSHNSRDEVWVVIAGEGRTLVDGMEQVVRVGDVITMEAGCRHTIFADTELKLIEVQLGKEVSVHDKQKYPIP